MYHRSQEGSIRLAGRLSMVRSEKCVLHLATHESPMTLLRALIGIWKQLEGQVGREEMKTVRSSRNLAVNEDD